MTGEHQAHNSRDDAYYTALLDAWFATRMEKDRALLALSTGGVALLATFLTTKGARSVCHLALYLLAAASFLISVCAAIWIFHRNAAYLEREKGRFERREPPAGPDRTLERLDAGLAASFIAGVVLTVGVAVISAWPVAGVTQMPEQRETRVVTPKETLERSLTGASAMRPAQQEPVGGATPQSQQPSGSAPSDVGSDSSSSSGTSAGEKK